jgi:DNA-directed RNA polymerase specialized sigma24 family protein
MTQRGASADNEIEDLVRQRDRFLAFVGRRTRDIATAEDILQSSYVKALASHARLRDRSSVVRWFFQILERSVVDHHRRSASRQRATEAVRARTRSPDLDAGLKAAVCACVEMPLGRYRHPSGCCQRGARRHGHREALVKARNPRSP